MPPIFKMGLSGSLPVGALAAGGAADAQAIIAS